MIRKLLIEDDNEKNSRQHVEFYCYTEKKEWIRKKWKEKIVASIELRKKISRCKNILTKRKLIN